MSSRRSLLVFVFTVLGTGPVLAEDTFSIATLNCEFLSLRNVHVKYGLPFDPRSWNDDQRTTWTAPGFRRARYEESIAAIAKTIDRIDADLIVLTEVARVPIRDGEFVTPNDLTVLHDVLRNTYPHMAHGDSTDKRTGQNVAILSRRPFTRVRHRIPGREGYYAELDDEDTETDTGVSKGLHVVVEVDGDPLHVYGAHLKSERGGHEADAQRVAQASIVRRNYLPTVLNGGLVVVAGDLNDRRAQPALRRIRGFDDIQEDLAQTAGPNFFRRGESEPPATFNARIRDHWTLEYNVRKQQLDHILLSASIVDRCTSRNHRKRMQLDFLDVTATIGDTGRPATDHRAVKLTLEFVDDHR